MSSPSRYDLELADVNYIVERYQQRAFEADPSAGAYSSFLNVIESSRQIINITAESISSADIGTFNVEIEEREDIIAKVPCSSDIEFEQVVEGLDKGIQNAEKFSTNKRNKDIASVDATDTAKCINCGERPEFLGEINFKPVFALDGLRDMLNSINNSVDQMMQQLDPYSFVNGLCPFLDTFANRTCTFDLKALLGLINMLIGRYSMSAMKMTLNWSFLLGPMIKAVAEVATSFIEEIMKQISYLFSCFRTFLLAAKELIFQAQKIISETGNLGNRLLSDQILDKNNHSLRSSKINAKNTATSFSNPAGKGSLSFKDYSLKDNISGKSSFKANGSGELNLTSFYKTGTVIGKQAKKKGLFDGIQYGYEGSLENMFGLNKDPKNMNALGKGVQGASNLVGAINTELLDRLLAILNSSESYIKGLLGNLVLSIKSLNSMIGQSFSTTIKLGGLILFLVDMFNLCVSLAKGGFGFSNGICQKVEEGDFEYFDALLKSLYGEDSIFDIEGLVNGQVRIDSGIYDLDSIKCGSLPQVSEEDRNKSLGWADLEDLIKG